ncbi:DUF2490 domain-containing protein [Pedobacter sp. ASV1-7]|uniref:DUF2490 domain-containing protein n=1 Tax=Pedobacter sp. ASV1-7 TaxID=3145237 RepID=UPI0032E8F6C6
MKHLIFTFLISLFVLNSFSQHVNQNSGWLMLLNGTKFNDKWGMHLDLQLRTANDWDGVRNVLFRPGLTYYINKNSNATAGYLLTNTYVKQDGAANNTLTEHRIWEQYIYTHRIKSVYAQHRFRLEQRFMETAGGDVFSQRFRYFFRAILPISGLKESFVEGPFVALQNELFFNIQNKDQLNGKLFDQNRAYGAVGYRFSKSFDIEAGYLNQYLKGRSNNTTNHAVQLAFYTRF